MRQLLSSASKLGVGTGFFPERALRIRSSGNSTIARSNKQAISVECTLRVLSAANQFGPLRLNIPVSIFTGTIHQSPPARGQASAPSIPTAFSDRTFARKNFGCAPETGKSIRSPVGIRKLYVDATGFCVFRRASVGRLGKANRR